MNLFQVKKVCRALLPFLAVVCAFAGDEPGARFWELQKQIAASFKKQDYHAALEQLKESEKLVPDRPSAMLRTARAYAYLGDESSALAQLQRLLDMQVYFDLTKEPAFEKLRSSAKFQELVREMEKLSQRQEIHASVAFKIPDTEFFPEGIAYDPRSGDVFVGSMRRRKIVRVTPTGRVADFITPGQDGLWGVSGIGIDTGRSTLWACSTAFEASEGYTPADEGNAAAFAFDLDSGKLKGRYALGKEKQHFCDGVVAGPDGTAYVADSQGLAVLRVKPGSKEAETLVPRAAGISPQGMALSKDGKRLFVSDYMSGIYAVELKSEEISRVRSTARASLAGIDGLVSYSGDLIAIQNGITPNRVVRIKMDRDQREITEVEVLEMNHPQFGEPTLGAIKGDTLLFVANNPISSFLDDHQLSGLPEPVVLQRRLR